jgi:hypothetical protein
MVSLWIWLCFQFWFNLVGRKAPYAQLYDACDSQALEKLNILLRPISQPAKRPHANKSLIRILNSRPIREVALPKQRLIFIVFVQQLIQFVFHYLKKYPHSITRLRRTLQPIWFKYSKNLLNLMSLLDMSWMKIWLPLILIVHWGKQQRNTWKNWLEELHTEALYTLMMFLMLVVFILAKISFEVIST